LAEWPFAGLASATLRSLRLRRSQATCRRRRAGTARKDGPRGLVRCTRHRRMRGAERCVRAARGTTHDCHSRSSLGVNQRDRDVSRMPCATMWRRATSTNDYAQWFCGGGRSSRLRAAGACPRDGAEASAPGPRMVRSAPYGATRRLRGLRARLQWNPAVDPDPGPSPSLFGGIDARIQNHGRSPVTND
jgi:hypothetical protein